MRRQEVFRTLWTLGFWAICCRTAVADDLLRFSYNVPGDSKPIIVRADDMATWVEDGQRILLLKGQVLVEHGVVQIHMQQGVAWIDQQGFKQTGILKVQVYAEDNVTLENGPESRSGTRALVDVRTRGEVKLKSHNGKVTQQVFKDDPLYRRGLEARASPPKEEQQQQPQQQQPIQQASFQPAQAAQPLTAPSAVPARQPVDPSPATPSWTPGPAIPSPPPMQPGSPPSQAAAPTVSPGPLAPSATQAPVGSTPAPQPSTLVPAPPPPVRPPPTNVAAPGPPRTGNQSSREGTLRQVSIVPRTSAGLTEQSFLMPNGETATVVNGGVILIIRTADKTGLVDIEADRLVTWTRGNPQQLLDKLRTPQGQQSKELEFYLSGNVEIRQQTGPDTRTLKADEVYYDVGRNVAVAMHADLEFRQKGIPDPIHVRAEELNQLNQGLFKVVKAEVFSSRLPSDPGLKVYVAEATIEEKDIPKRSIFGVPVYARNTGEQEIEHQRLFDGKNVFVEFEDIPIFYLPFLRGDANDPLGPLESVGFNYNRIFGFQFTTSFNVFDLLGIDPLPGTRWRLDLDYLSRRGPAAGTNFEYSGKTFLGLPAAQVGEVKAYGIYDTGTDILGGGRGELEPHPNWRGRFFWRQNVQNLPDGFSVQAQVAALSDKNFLEQYYKMEFDQDINQETFLYIKQQRDNWAWTVLTEPNIRNWVTETEWLPRADGYLIGQSFFDVFTYNAHASLGYGRLRPTDVPPPVVEFTDTAVGTFRGDLNQELSLPFTLGPFRLVPYGVLDLTYYSDDLAGADRERLYGGGGVRGSIPFTRLYADVESDLLNLKGINHKIVISSTYFVAGTQTHINQLPQLDRLNDDATDQALRDIKPVEPVFNPGNGIFLQKSPLYDPQLYALRRLVDNRVDTLDTIEVIQGDIYQRWQTKRGYPGLEHIVDWMTLDLSGSYFPHSTRDDFGANFAFLQYDWTWNIGDRTALTSTGWYDPEDHGPRVFTIGAYLNRPDRTSFYLGYRQIEPLNSQAVIGAVSYVFSPKYALTASSTFDFGVNTQINSLVLTRMGSDLQLSLGFTYNSLVSNFGVTFEIVPNIVPPTHRIPGLAALGQGGVLGR